MYDNVHIYLDLVLTLYVYIVGLFSFLAHRKSFLKHQPYFVCTLLTRLYFCQKKNFFVLSQIVRIE